MTVSNDLIYETLKAIEATLAQHGQRLDDLVAELRTVNALIERRLESADG